MRRVPLFFLILFLAFACSQPENSNDSKASNIMADSELFKQYEAVMFNESSLSLSYHLNKKYHDKNLLFPCLVSDVFEYDSSLFLTAQSLTPIPCFIKTKIDKSFFERTNECKELIYVILKNVKFKKFDIEIIGQSGIDYLEGGKDSNANDIFFEVPVDKLIYEMSYSFMVTGDLMGVSCPE